ncbi:hypothetical protein ACWEQ8_35150 [Streptomyces noursei]
MLNQPHHNRHLSHPSASDLRKQDGERLCKDGGGQVQGVHPDDATLPYEICVGGQYDGKVLFVAQS